MCGTAITIEVVRNKMLEASPVREASQGFCVHTHCIFPGGELVVISIRQGQNGTFILSDDGQATSVIHNACINFSSKQINEAQEHAQDYGASFERGCFTLPDINLDALPVAVITFANFIQWWVHVVIDQNYHRMPG